MELQWLRAHIGDLQTRLHHFQRMQHTLEVMYQQSINHYADLATKSALMEQYSVHVDRQQKAVDRMNQLHEKARAQLRAKEAR